MTFSIKRFRRRGTPRIPWTTSALLAVLSVCGVQTGCGTDIGPIVPPVSNGSSGEPNDTFADAIEVIFDAFGAAGIQGAVATIGDLDVFLLGAFSPGDRIVVDADTIGSSLDVSVALFDDEQRLVFANDDRGGLSRFLDSFVELFVRHAGENYYLVVAGSAFATPGTETGQYFIDITVSGGHPVPEPVGQILLLDFDGAFVDSQALGSPGLLDPFDAGDIARIYAGETEAMKEAIRQIMEEDFEPFDIAIVTTDDPPLPSDIEFSTVVFGGLNLEAFGISEQVDIYNLDFCDDAVIFTESFSPQFFGQTPTAAELAVAIANVASHEAGHLLGLNHVSDDRALMDDVSPTDVLLNDQVFRESVLSPDIIPIGTQDSVLLLMETIGPNPDTVLSRVVLRPGGSQTLTDGY